MLISYKSNKLLEFRKKLMVCIKNVKNVSPVCNRIEIDVSFV